MINKTYTVYFKDKAGNIITQSIRRDVFDEETQKTVESFIDYPITLSGIATGYENIDDLGKVTWIEDETCLQVAKIRLGKVFPNIIGQISSVHDADQDFLDNYFS